MYKIVVSEFCFCFRTHFILLLRNCDGTNDMTEIVDALLFFSTEEVSWKWKEYFNGMNLFNYNLYKIAS